MRHLQRRKYFVVLHAADGEVATIQVEATSAFEAEQEAVARFKNAGNAQQKVTVLKVFTKGV